MQLPIATEAPVEATPDAATATAEDATELAALSEAFGAAATPVKPRKGLFAFLKPDPAPSPFAGADIAVLDGETVAAADGEAVATEGGEGADEALAETAALMAETAVPAKAGLGGFFSFLKPKAPSAPETLHQAAAAPEDFETRPETLGVEPDADARPDAAESAPATPRKGLFGGLLAALPKAGGHAGGTTSTTSIDETLSFGTVGINCEVRPARVAEKVDTYPRDGQAVWTLYDTDPGSTVPHTQLITGFADGCARQVTASLVMFGAAGLHEVHRYSDAMSEEPWSKADKTYETLKARVCGVKKRTSCPADKLPELEQRVAFASVYKEFGGEGAWMELLIGDGNLLAEEIR